MTLRPNFPVAMVRFTHEEISEFAENLEMPITKEQAQDLIAKHWTAIEEAMEYGAKDYLRGVLAQMVITQHNLVESTD